MKIRPFRVNIPEDALADLRERLAQTRWLEPDGESEWESGPPVGYLRDLAEHWRDRFDWRRVEARINALPNFVASIDGRRDPLRPVLERRAARASRSS